MVSTLDFESSDPGSNPGRSSFFFSNRRLFVFQLLIKRSVKCPCGQMDKASVSGAEDWGFESLQGCLFTKREHLWSSWL